MVKMISAKDAAMQLGVSERALCRYIAQDLIEGFKVGREWKFTQAGIDDYLKRRSSLAMKGRRTPAKAVPEAQQRVAA